MSEQPLTRQQREWAAIEARLEAAHQAWLRAQLMKDAEGEFWDKVSQVSKMKEESK